MPHLTLFYSGDIHGRVDNFLRLAHLLNQQQSALRQVGRSVLVLDAGDCDDRALLESDLTHGAAMFQLLRSAGYDAAVIGHDVLAAYGPDALRTITQTSELPLLCANLLTNTRFPSPLPGMQPTRILPCGPVRVGLIGLTTPQRTLYTERLNLHVPDDLASLVAAHVRALRAAGCGVVGVLSHIGLAQDKALAQTVPSLDFIIGGHSHSLLEQPEAVNGIPICHAGHFGTHLGRLDLMLDESHSVTDWTGALHAVPADLPPDPIVAEKWHRLQGAVNVELQVKVGTLTDSLDLASNRACGMGQLLADALRVRMRADVALCITGHLRRGLKAGPITLRDIYETCRTDAAPVVTDLTGALLHHMLEHGAAPGVRGAVPFALRGMPVGILQSSGLTCRVEVTAPHGRRIADVRVHGEPLDLLSDYRVAATSYEFDPDHGYLPGLDPATVQTDAPAPLCDVLRDHFALFDPLTPGLRPRVTIVR